MEKSGFVRGNANAENADVLIFMNEVMVRLLRYGNRCRCLGEECG
jgi:hypothetical protein